MKTNYVAMVVVMLALPTITFAGPHWIDTLTTPSVDNRPMLGSFSVDNNLDCIADLTLNVSGPGIIRRTAVMDDSSQFPGMRPIDGHMDVIDTEILTMNLTGGGRTVTMGINLGTLPLAASLGSAAEQAGDPALADSFFDVFFEIDLGGGNRLYNQTPLRFSSTGIDGWPSANACLTSGQCVPLYSSPTPGQGVHLANLSGVASFGGVPEPSSLCLLGLVLVAVAGFRRRHVA